VTFVTRWRRSDGDRIQEPHRGGAATLADAQSIIVITSDIVYDLATAVEDFFTGKRGPAALGELEVLALFNQEKLPKQLVGGRVTNGRSTSANRLISCVGRSADAARHRRHSRFARKEDRDRAGGKRKRDGVYVDAAVKIEVGDRLVIRK